MSGRRGLLDRLEALGNALPDPTTLFAVGALAVMMLSQVAVPCGWSAEKTVTRDVRVAVTDATGRPVVDPASGETLTVAALDDRGRPLQERVRERIEPVGLLEPDGLYWVLRHLVENFVRFPPLGIVLVGMLGIGLAERTGFVTALLRATLLAVPAWLLTPTVFLVGVLSSMTLDAGYVVLPPVAAALFHAVGRPPLAGLAAVFAGVSAGFSANLFLTGLDPLLAGFSEAGARFLDPTYVVAVTCNWWFMIASTFLVTGVGWAVTAAFVEPRLRARPPEAGGPPAAGDGGDVALTPQERFGLGVGLAVLVATLVLFVMAAWIPGAPLHGLDGRFPRWVAVVVPLLFLGFALPGAAYGFATGSLRNDRDVARLMGETMAAMGPYVVLAFFAAQFIELFRHSRLGEMLALTGGAWLAELALPATGLVAAFVGVVAVANLFIGSMSAKYAFFAPVFVPMFMQVGISPELTQAAYRVGDSVSNVITPLNPYVVIVLVFMQRYVPRAGVGTLVALMLPYAAALLVTWTALLALWIGLGLELGPGGPLAYAPPAP